MVTRSVEATVVEEVGGTDEAAEAEPSSDEAVAAVAESSDQDSDATIETDSVPERPDGSPESES